MTRIVQWGGLAYMSVQFGILARLTWWEYSWDIMEPVTYFITYSGIIGMYCYFLLTGRVSEASFYHVLYNHVRNWNSHLANTPFPPDFNNHVQRLRKLEPDLVSFINPDHPVRNAYCITHTFLTLSVFFFVLYIIHTGWIVEILVFVFLCGC